MRVCARKRPAKKRVETLKKRKGLHARAEAATASGGSGVAVGSCAMRKALHVCCGAERTVGSGSGIRGAVRGVRLWTGPIIPSAQMSADEREVLSASQVRQSITNRTTFSFYYKQNFK